MADSKIDFSFENLHFSCKGDNAWVERQLNMVLSRIPTLLSAHKKGENFVEEVIDVKAEEERESTPMGSKISGKDIKPAKAKKPKAVKEKAVRQKMDKETDPTGSEEIKSAKAPAEGVKVKSRRKTKTASKASVKKKATKKKTAKAGADEVQTDSPLLNYLTEKKVTTNQVRKFLATAVFLSRNNNVSKLSTSMISRALKSYKIDKLQNASDCLNKNEKKGYCIKDGKEFIITENGYLSIE